MSRLSCRDAQTLGREARKAENHVMRPSGSCGQGAISGCRYGSKTHRLGSPALHKCQSIELGCPWQLDVPTKRGTSYFKQKLCGSRCSALGNIVHGRAVLFACQGARPAGYATVEVPCYLAVHTLALRLRTVILWRKLRDVS